MTLSALLPFEIFPTDDEQIEIEKFSITCPKCRAKLDHTVLQGEIEHDTIKKAVIKLDCQCSCGAEINQTYRMQVESRKLVAYQKVSASLWKQITLE